MGETRGRHAFGVIEDFRKSITKPIDPAHGPELVEGQMGRY